MELPVPRDRQRRFEPQPVERCGPRLPGFDDKGIRYMRAGHDNAGDRGCPSPRLYSSAPQGNPVGSISDEAMRFSS